jgi:hypothetical protein
LGNGLSQGCQNSKSIALAQNMRDFRKYNGKKVIFTEIYQVTKNLPKEELFIIKQQLRRVIFYLQISRLVLI